MDVDVHMWLAENFLESLLSFKQGLWGPNPGFQGIAPLPAESSCLQDTALDKTKTKTREY